MRIGIDARPLAIGWGGISRGIGQILEALGTIDNKNDYFLYAHRDFSLPQQNGRWQKRLDASFSWMPGTLWLQTAAKRMILRDHLDLFLGTMQILPLGLPSTLRKVLIVHDLVWKLYPQTTSNYNRWVQRFFALRSIQEADRIVAFSGSTKQDLVGMVGLDPARITVIHNGVSPAFQPHDRQKAAKYIAGRYGVSSNYICTVGTLEPRKNLATLIKAFAILRKHDGAVHQLVIAGPKGWGNLQLRRKYEVAGLTERNIKFLGFVPDPDLPLLYAGAAAFVFPSLYEGFGLPLLEAMACGTPVACSNRSSLPEIGADAVLYFDPESPEEIARVVGKILNDHELRETLNSRGLQRARQFTWELCASKLLSTFNEVAQMPVSVI